MGFSYFSNKQSGSQVIFSWSQKWWRRAVFLRKFFDNGYRQKVKELLWTKDLVLCGRKRGCRILYSLMGIFWFSLSACWFLSLFRLLFLRTFNLFKKFKSDQEPCFLLLRSDCVMSFFRTWNKRETCSEGELCEKWKQTFKGWSTVSGVLGKLFRKSFLAREPWVVLRHEGLKNYRNEWWKVPITVPFSINRINQKSSLPGYPRWRTFQKNRMIKRKFDNDAQNIPLFKKGFMHCVLAFLPWSH